MENESNVKLEWKVGAFVGLGLLLAMVSILVLGGNRIAFTRYVHVVSYFEEVQGLFPGSVVSLAGLPVGNVKRIKFAQGQNKLAVEMDIDQQFAERVVEGTTSDVRTQGALGDKYVYLTPGPPVGKSLPDGAVIATNDSGDIMKLLTSKDEGVGQVLGLIKELRALVASLNANGRAAGTFENASSAALQLKNTLVQMDGLIRDLRSEIPHDQKMKLAISALASVMQKIDQGKGTLGALVNDPSVHQRLKAMLGGSQRNAYLKDMLRDSIKQNEDAKK